MTTFVLFPQSVQLGATSAGATFVPVRHRARYQDSRLFVLEELREFGCGRGVAAALGTDYAVNYRHSDSGQVAEAHAF